MNATATLVAGIAAALVIGVLIGRAWEPGVPNVGASATDASATMASGDASSSSRASVSLRPSKVRDSPATPPGSKAQEDAKGQGQSPVAREAAVKELAKLKQEHVALKEALKASNEKMAELETAAGLTRDRHQFDLNQEDWRKLGEAGALMLRLPCASEESARVDDEALDRLGLAPDDRPAIAEAYRHSRERQWAALGSACATALGGSIEKARERGLQSCKHLVIQHGQDQGNKTLDSVRRVASFRAGDSEAPPKDSGNPLDSVMLALTREAGLFEAELAEALGPAEAHRVMFTQDGLCFVESTFGLDKPLRADGPWGLER